MKEKLKIRLEKLGFNRLSKKVDEGVELKKKLKVAYANYEYINKEKVDEFDWKIRDDSKNQKCLAQVSLDDYDKIPPDDVLDELEEAKELKCFDSFVILCIEKVKDPILCGKINNCTDFFIIAEWGDDITVEDLLLGDTARAKEFEIE